MGSFARTNPLLPKWQLPEEFRNDLVDLSGVFRGFYGLLEESRIQILMFGFENYFIPTPLIRLPQPDYFVWLDFVK